MSNTYIWSIDMVHSKPDSDIEIEIFSGRDKYTKTGLFSGPLRRQNISSLSNDATICFLFSLDGVAQIDKNIFRLNNSAVIALVQYFEQNQMLGVYCRLPDKKRHRVRAFSVHMGSSRASQPLLTYDAKSGVLSCLYSEPLNLQSSKETSFVLTPSPQMYLESEGEIVRGFLTFTYNGVEVQASSKLAEIPCSSGVLLRNLRYEQDIQRQVYAIGGKQSLRNEITFKKKAFFSEILPSLLKTDLTLYWGKRQDRISKAKVSCSISYNMDWFSVSGLVTDGTENYDLSNLLRASRGKSYVELKDGILFLPDAFKKIAHYATKDEQTYVPHKDLWAIHCIAASQGIDSTKYLHQLSNFSNFSLSLSAEWETILRPYQKNGVAWALNLYQNGFSGCLADDMGLGKTIQAIAFLCSREKKRELPDLIVLPKIVLYNWSSELRRFAPKQKFAVAYGDFDYSTIREDAIIYLTTYDTLIRHNEAFAAMHYDTIIMDETQAVKNYRTKRYQALKNLNAQFMLALSGTPIENNIEELWSLFNLLNPGMLGSHSSFMKTFALVNTDNHQLERLKTIVSPFVLRRTKESELKDLPPKEEHHVYCEMDNGQRTLYDALLKSTRDEIARKPSRYEIKDNAIILQALLYLRETCSDPELLPPELRSAVPCSSCKLELFQEYATRIVPTSGKVIVYSLFPRVLKKMQTWCQLQGWKTFYIDGTTNNRQVIVEDFEQSEQGVFFISLKAGGVGLNLTSCQYVLIYDPWWNSAAEQQAANRVHRIGQDKPVFIYHFLVKDTIEEKIYKLQEEKSKLSASVLDGLDQPDKLSIDELYELLS